jgi:hypothetical protein
MPRARRLPQCWSVSPGPALFHSNASRSCDHASFGIERARAEIAREQIERHHQKNIASSLSGALAPQRTGVMLALIAGFQMMRQTVGLPALAKAEPKGLVKVLGPLFERLLT